VVGAEVIIVVVVASMSRSVGGPNLHAAHRDATPIDLFFSYDPFHEAAGAARRFVPFGDGTIPILAPEHLIVCKVVFNRAKDWVDIDSILEGGLDIDVAEVVRWAGRIAGDEDPRYNRITAVLTRS
jgi:hypothetical protein